MINAQEQGTFAIVEFAMLRRRDDGLMSAMEKQTWAATLALRWEDPDGGVAAADKCLRRLRELKLTRDERLEPEYEMAKAAINMDFAEFAGWYPLQHRLHHRYSPGGYVAPSSDDVAAAYERFARSLTDFW